MLSLAPVAIFTAIFRPFPWEVGSPTMVFSSIENIILIIFSTYLLISINPLYLFRAIFKDPFLVYCLVFSILFSFGVGLASANFGALVRYKIPMIPFFFTFLVLARNITHKTNF